MIDEAAGGEDRYMGSGDFPPELDRVNWAAVLFGPLWGLFYGIWPWVAALVGIRLGTMTIAYALSRIPAIWDVVSRFYSVAGWALYAGAGVMFAFRANRLAWSASAKMLASATPEHASGMPQTVARFISAQRVLAWAGIVAMVAVPLQNLRDDFGQIDPARVRSALYGYAFAAVAMLVLFAADRMRSARLSRS